MWRVLPYLIVATVVGLIAYAAITAGMEAVASKLAEIVGQLPK